MPFKLTSNFNFRNIRRKAREVTERAFRQTAEQVKRDIVTRTQSGVDVNGRSFAPYSQSYRERKRTGVNLTRTGQMLNSIQVSNVRSSGTKVEADVGVTGARNQEIAGYHQQGTTNMPQRQFLGVTQNRIRALVNRIINTLRL